MNPRWLVVVAALLAVSARDARAICGATPEVTALPARLAPAPLDARVLLRLDASYRERGVGCPVERPCEGARTTFELRTAPRTGLAPVRIPTDAEETTSGVAAFVTLVHGVPLSPETAYEVWAIDASGKAAPRIVGAFTTGTGRDTSPPAWSGILRASMTHAPPPGQIRLPMECGAPRLSFDVAIPHDDLAGLTSLRAAMWIADPGATIDYAAPPRVYEPLFDQGSRAGYAVVLAGNADDADDDDLPAVDGTRPVLVGMKIVDLAGHASPASEMVVR